MLEAVLTIIASIFLTLIGYIFIRLVTAVDKLIDRIDDHSTRIVRIETRLDINPSH